MVVFFCLLAQVENVLRLILSHKDFFESRSQYRSLTPCFTTRSLDADLSGVLESSRLRNESVGDLKKNVNKRREEWKASLCRRLNSWSHFSIILINLFCTQQRYVYELSISEFVVYLNMMKIKESVTRNFSIYATCSPICRVV